MGQTFDRILNCNLGLFVRNSSMEKRWDGTRLWVIAATCATVISSISSYPKKIKNYYVYEKNNYLKRSSPVFSIDKTLPFMQVILLVNLIISYPCSWLKTLSSSCFCFCFCFLFLFNNHLLIPYKKKSYNTSHIYIHTHNISTIFSLFLK